MVAGHARPRLTLVRKERALSRLSGKEWARAKPRSRKERTGSGMVAGHPLSTVSSRPTTGGQSISRRDAEAQRRGGLAPGQLPATPDRGRQLTHAPLGKEWALAKPQGRKEGSGSGTVAGRARPSPTAPVTSPPRPRQSWARAHDPVTARPVHPARSAPLRLCERKTTGAHTNATRHGPASRRPAATQPLGVFASLRDENAGAETAATRRGPASRHPAATQPLGGLAPWREPNAAAHTSATRHSPASRHPAAAQPLGGLARAKRRSPTPERPATARPAAISRPLPPLAAWRLGESKLQPPRPQRSRGAAGERRKPAPTRVGHGRGQGHGALAVRSTGRCRARGTRS